MKQTIKNHINPQSLLGFWCINGKLVCFNKVTKRTLRDMAPKEVCFKKHFLPQQWEDEFSHHPDAEIKNVVHRIITSGVINDEDKLFMSRFLVMHKGLRDPLFRKIIDNIHAMFPLPPVISDDIKKVLLLNSISEALKESAPALIKMYIDMRWRLLQFDEPCLITNESITSLEMTRHDDLNDRTFYFPISPKHCILLYTLEKYDSSEVSAEYINDLMARIPETNWIVFNEEYDPMPDIVLIENGRQVWPTI